MSRVAALVCWYCAAAGAAAWGAEPSDQIARLIRQLGADKVVERDEATRQLWEQGLNAEPALRKALDSADPEVRFRARALLDRIRFGIFPSTPPEIVSLIQRFRSGDFNTRLEVLKQLAEKEQFTSVLALIHSESDENQRRGYLQTFAHDPSGILGRMADAGKWTEIEGLLEAGIVGPEGYFVWVSYLSARGRLDARIAAFRSRVANGDAEAQRPLAYLLRASGDLRGARESAEKLGDSTLVRALAFEQGDWATVSKLFEQGFTEPPAPIGNPRGQQGSNRKIELLGYSAAFHRLAGHEAEFRAQVAAIESLANEPEMTGNIKWYCAEALLINNQPTAAFRWLKGGNPNVLFDLLAYRQEYEAAFELVAWKPGMKYDEAWFDSLPAIAANPGLARQNRFRLATQVARTLHVLGLRDESRRLLEFLDQVARDTTPAKHQTSPDTLWMRLAFAEMRMGLLTESNQHAARVVAREDQVPQLRSLFGTRVGEAEAWFRYWRRRASQEPVEKTLQRVHEALAWMRTAPADTKDLEAAAEVVDKEFGGVPVPERWKLVQGMAATCLNRSRPDLARKLLEPLAGAQAEAHFPLADALREMGEWLPAADHYQSAYTADRTQLAARWLAGECLIRGGRVDEGKRHKEFAVSLAVTGPLLQSLAQAIGARQYRTSSTELWERLLRTGAFEHSEWNEASRVLGDRYLAKDPRRAAELWERHMLSDLRVYFSFLESESYVRFPLLIHRNRARAALEAGDFDLARREIEIARQAAPQDVLLVEELAPLFEERERRADADQLFDTSYAYLERSLAAYPDSPEHLNNLAWMAARAHRRLDDALRLAKKAVELAPREPNYLDTLAEVEFRRGQREAAIEWSQKSIDIAPRYKPYQRQLERFRTAPFPTRAERPLPEDAAVLD